MNLKLIIAQLNFLAGDIEGNTQRVIDCIQIAEKEKQADLIIFPELTLTYYSAEDLWLRPELDQRINIALQRIQALKSSIGILLGYPRHDGKHLFNEAAFIQNGQLITTYQKQYLPNYNVFNEKRYFTPGTLPPPIFLIRHQKIAFMICEDIWHPEPIQQAADQGAEFLIVINASPFTKTKQEERIHLLKKQASTHQISIAYVNWVGGQDDLVFDGGSFIMNRKGEIIHQAPFFKEILWEIEVSEEQKPLSIPPVLPISRIYEALVLGTRDYIEKNGFKGVLIGLSGGIDSALTLAIAVEALGNERVKAIMMPSRFTSPLSLTYAQQQAEYLGVEYQIIDIEPIFTQFLNTLNMNEIGIAAENLQARCRGIILMTQSNQTDTIVLITSNKSEMAVGYTTLYGDMAGGFAVLKDIYKTTVYELADYRNQISPTILTGIIKRLPTAELAYNQKDQDTLPPYIILDKILYSYIEENKSAMEIILEGFEQKMVENIIKKINISEYKRKQAPIGIKISSVAFGREWKFPVSAKKLIEL